MFLAANKNGNQFVKDLNGKPVWYATWNRSEAHLFDTAEEAQEFVDGQFRGKGQVIEIVSKSRELVETEGTRITSGVPETGTRRRRVKDINDEFGWDEIR